jgi:hypothetical protein
VHLAREPGKPFGNLNAVRARADGFYAGHLRFTGFRVETVDVAEAAAKENVDYVFCAPGLWQCGDSRKTRAR